MEGRAWPRVVVRPLLLWAAALAGCDADPPPLMPSAGPLSEAATAYDASTAGEVAGRVTWAGDIPAAPPFLAPTSPLCEQEHGPRREWTNPNAPRIDPQGRGVVGAVVFLRGVDPRRARPWDLGPVRIELHDYEIHIFQSDADGRVGFVRRGDAIDLESKQNIFQAVQALGADFFALALPAGAPPRSRVLDRNGVVELTSNTGQFWMRAYLFVDDHPYYARTVADGGYSLPHVPPGDYDLVCWAADWREAEHEIDADTRLVTRLTFRPPLQVVRRIHIDPRATATADFTLSAGQFGAVKPTVP